jgi:hypothetical protein
MCVVWDVALRGIQTILPISLYISAHEGLVPVNRMTARLLADQVQRHSKTATHMLVVNLNLIHAMENHE